MKIEVNFRSWSLKERGRERMQNVLKNFFWVEGEEPDNWQSFDNEIEISNMYDKGGDCFTVSIDDKAWDGRLKNSTVSFLKGVREIRKLSIFIDKDEDISFVLPYLHHNDALMISSNRPMYIKTWVDI